LLEFAANVSESEEKEQRDGLATAAPEDQVASEGDASIEGCPAEMHDGETCDRPIHAAPAHDPAPVCLMHSRDPGNAVSSQGHRDFREGKTQAAIAILGIVVLDAFERHLAQDAAQINLAPQIRNELDGQRIKLAAIGIPEQIDTATRERIKRSIDESFVAGFRVVMLIASGLALASAVTAWSVIRDKP
jgi:hypothetical protein